MGGGAPIQIMRTGDGCLYQLSHLAVQGIAFRDGGANIISLSILELSMQLRLTLNLRSSVSISLVLRL